MLLLVPSVNPQPTHNPHTTHTTHNTHQTSIDNPRSTMINLRPGILLLLACSLATTAATKRTVLIFRHCIRSTPTTAYGEPGYDTFDNYTSPSHTWPGWGGVPVYQCRTFNSCVPVWPPVHPSLPRRPFVTLPYLNAYRALCVYAANIIRTQLAVPPSLLRGVPRSSVRTQICPSRSRHS